MEKEAGTQIKCPQKIWEKSADCRLLQQNSKKAYITLNCSLIMVMQCISQQKMAK